MKYESKMRDVIFPRYWHFDVLFFSLLLLLFSAVKPRSFIICERRKGVISCQNGKRIDVLNANYGRQDSETCSSSSVTRTNCRSSNSLKLVQNKCNGKTSCELHATNSEFGDPCSRTYKYLEVEYRCLEFISLGKWKNGKMCLIYASHCSYSRQSSMALARQCCYDTRCRKHCLGYATVCYGTWFYFFCCGSVCFNKNAARLVGLMGK